MTHNPIVRPARPDDLAAINAIYNYYVAHSTCVWTTEPCSEAERQTWYQGHGPSMPVLVAEQSGSVVGWGALGSFRPAYTAAGMLEDSNAPKFKDFLHRSLAWFLIVLPGFR